MTDQAPLPEGPFTDGVTPGEAVPPQDDSRPEPRHLSRLSTLNAEGQDPDAVSYELTMRAAFDLPMGEEAKPDPSTWDAPPLAEEDGDPEPGVVPPPQPPLPPVVPAHPEVVEQPVRHAPSPVATDPQEHEEAESLPAREEPAPEPRDAPEEPQDDVTRDLVLVSAERDRREHHGIARERGWDFIDLDNPEFDMTTIEPELIALISPRTARSHNVLPLRTRGRMLTVAMPDLDDAEAIADLREEVSGYTVMPVYANPATIRRGVEMVYSAASEAASIASERRQVATSSGTGGDLGRIVSSAKSAVSRRLSLTIEQALREGASDIHFEPTRDALIVRYRVDGQLRIAARYSRDDAQPLMTKIKVDAKMKTDNFFVPDSGVLRHETESGQIVDIRVEISPTGWGSAGVMRLQQSIWRPMDSLGLSPVNDKRVRQALSVKSGLLLATGPTGSGKTTSLYSFVNEKIDESTKIITLENPIEYLVPDGVTQHPVNVEQKMTFATGLRSILREDPDVVLVGEVRDSETAEVAVDAAMTGHLVLSTLHTNDAVGVIPRLLRLGIDPFLVSSSLLCVVGQRLVRRLCNECKVSQESDPDLVMSLDLEIEGMPDEIFSANPEGCRECHRGYAGRVPIHEVLLVTDEVGDLIEKAASTDEILSAARRGGMTSMHEDAWWKVKEGITDMAELVSWRTRAFG